MNNLIFLSISSLIPISLFYSYLTHYERYELPLNGVSVIALGIFWFLMIRDLYKRKQLKNKILWGALMVFCSWIGSAIYCNSLLHAHKRWVEDYSGNGKNARDDKWTKSIAVGNRDFVETIKSLMGILAIGRKSTKAEESYQLREPPVAYGDHFGSKKGDIGSDNTHFWDVKL